MKATIEFNLAEPYEVREHFRMLKAVDMSIALFDIEQMFRNKLKYDEDLPDDAYNEIDKLRNLFYEIIDEQALRFTLTGE